MSSPSPGESSSAIVHEGWDHLRARRPLAAWASWQRALRRQGESEAAARALERLEKSGDLPAAARAVYRLRAPSDPARRAAWDERLGGAVGGLAHADDGAGNGRGVIVNADLAAMADAFGRLADDDPADVAARYNQALCLAWLGSNRPAILALRDVARREAIPAPDGAIGAWTLAEVLRAGGGAEEFADDLRFACTIPWDPADTPDLLREFPEIHRRPTPQAPGDDPTADGEIEVFEWLDRRPTGSEKSSPGPTATALALPVVLASVIVDPASRTLRLSSPRVELLQQAEERLFPRLGILAASRPMGGHDRRAGVGREAEPLPLPFLDADVWTVRMPSGLEPSRAADLRREWVEHYYEDLWIHRPRHALDDRSPAAAAQAAHRGDAEARAQLAAVVDFREQLGRRPVAIGLYHGYPFDRLRRRLGLELAEPDSVDPADLSCAPPWELAAIDPATLEDHRLVDAAASAVGLLDDALTMPMGVELLRRSIPIAGAVLIGAVSPKVRRAMRIGDPDDALRWIGQARPLADPGAAATLDIWRAEVLARAGRPDEARRVYDSLIGPDAHGAAMALDGAETLLDNRHLDEALPLLRRARDLARAGGLPWTARRAEGRLDELR